MTEAWEREYKRIQRKLGDVVDNAIHDAENGNYTDLLNAVMGVFNDMEWTRRRLIRAEYPKEIRNDY